MCQIANACQMTCKKIPVNPYLVVVFCLFVCLFVNVFSFVFCFVFVCLFVLFLFLYTSNLVWKHSFKIFYPTPLPHQGPKANTCITPACDLSLLLLWNTCWCHYQLQLKVGYNSYTLKMKQSEFTKWKFKASQFKKTFSCENQSLIDYSYTLP